MKKIISLKILISIFIGITCGLFLGLILNKPTNQPCPKVRFTEIAGIQDSSLHIGNDASTTNLFPTIIIKEGLIPNAELAAKIAYEYVKAIYGENSAQDQPYQIQLLNGQIWRVKGTLPPNMEGGTFQIALEKYTGKIIWIYHGK